MDPDPYSSFVLLSVLKPWDFGIIFVILAILLLLVFSALISGSEVAYFALSPKDRETLEDENSKTSKQVIDLLSRPKALLATILIGNNLVNVAIIILSSYLMELVFDFSGREFLGFIIQVVVVTLVLLIVGEISPKVYATKQSIKLAVLMSAPMLVMRKIFWPLSSILVKTTRQIDRKAKERDNGNNITADELSHALELTTDLNSKEEEQRILRGIVKFGSTEVRQVMTPRVDVSAFDAEIKYHELKAHILENGFSRIPIFEEGFDKVVGILYVKDLLPYLEEDNDFDYKKLLRPAYFVTENKKLDDLLREFQEKKNHMAVVVDEYGGSSGIITLEDIIEEIVGEISDEFDEDELVYSKLDDNNYVFEGKTALIDMYRVLDITGERFEHAKGDSDSIAGFILELSGKIPQKNEKIKFENFLFTIEAADKRRVKRIKVTLNTNLDHA